MNPCCDIMENQLAYPCEEHGTGCPDVVVRYDEDRDRFSLIAENAQYLCNYCPWCGASLPEWDLDVKEG